jgi:hypothetical protein
MEVGKSKLTDDFSHLVVVPRKKEFQCARFLPEKKPHPQTGAAFKDISSQTADGNTRMGVRFPETIRHKGEG